MDQQQRDKSYRGMDRASTEALYRADAAQAASAGWRPVASRWTGETLEVRYQYDAEVQQEPASPPASKGEGSRGCCSGCMVVLVIGFAGLVALAALGLVAEVEDADRDTTPAGQPKATNVIEPAMAQKHRDPTGDMRDGNGRAESGVGYQDLTSVEARLHGSELTLTMQARRPPPTSSNPTSEQIVYGYYVDIDRDRNPDYQVMVANDFGGRWEPSAFDMDAIHMSAGLEFPGSFMIAGRDVTLSLDVDDLRSVDTVQIAAFTEHIVFPDPVGDPFRSVERSDTVPESIWPDGSGWLEVSR